MAAQQLLSDTYSKYRLLQIFYKAIQSPFTKVCHGIMSLALSGKYHTVGAQQLLCIISQYWLYAETFYSIYDTEYISRIIFYNCYFHLFVDITHVTNLQIYTFFANYTIIHSIFLDFAISEKRSTFAKELTRYTL